MLNEQTAKAALDEYSRRAVSEPPTNLEGRGIVICGGGSKYFPCVWVCLNMLRRNGCTLPIELWHLGSQEMPPSIRRLVEPLGVQCVDALEMRKVHPARILNGWEIKPYAIIHSAFQEVLLLDADNVPLVDPTFLFETPEYRYSKKGSGSEGGGAVFWPDYGRLAPHRSIWRLTGVSYCDEPEFESGQILVDKDACWKALAVTMWLNEQSDFWYRHIHGDKETFHMGWRKVGQPYAMPSRGIHPLRGTMCQHDFLGRRIFQHRNQAKWTLAANKCIEGFEREDECLAILDELTPLVRCVLGVESPEESKIGDLVRTASERLTTRPHLYRRIGHDERSLEFLPNGKVGRGSAGCEVFWGLFQRGRELLLDILSPSFLTCRLTLTAGDVWRGRWERFEQMPVELSPQ